MKPKDTSKVTTGIINFFEYLGEDPNREGLRDTPRRVVNSWDRLFGGYFQDVKNIFTTFEEQEAIPHNQIILLRDISFYSTCEHHLLPFFGMAHVAYIPNKKIVGISKLARIVEVYARRLQIQERLGNQISMSLMEYLDPLASACILEATHFCMTSRGIEKQNSIMVTSSLRGTFLKDDRTRKELMSLINSRR